MAGSAGWAPGPGPWPPSPHGCAWSRSAPSPGGPTGSAVPQLGTSSLRPSETNLSQLLTSSPDPSRPHVAFENQGSGLMIQKPAGEQGGPHTCQPREVRSEFPTSCSQSGGCVCGLSRARLPTGRVSRPHRTAEERALPTPCQAGRGAVRPQPHELGPVARGRLEKPRPWPEDTRPWAQWWTEEGASLAQGAGPGQEAESLLVSDACWRPWGF